MTAVCAQRGRVWNISIRTSPVGYVCPDCEYRERMVRTGVIKEVIQNFTARNPHDRNRPVDKRTSLSALNACGCGASVGISE